MVQPQFRAPLRALSSAWMLADLERARHPASSLSRLNRHGRDRCERSESRRGLHPRRRAPRRGSECRKYLQAPGSSCVQGRGRGRQNIFEQINNSTGAVEYLHHDQAGSTRLLTGSTGTVTGKCTYSAYGTPACEGTATTPLGYDGQYTSSDTGLIYMRARTYDPTTAQLLTRDPWVSLTGEPYSYGEDNPLNRADPTGRCGLICIGGIVLGGVAVATGVGEVVAGGVIVTEGTLGAVSAVSGVVVASADLKECVGGSNISCVGATVGGLGALGAVGVVSGVLGVTAESGAAAIGITTGGIGFLGDVAGALASPSPENTAAVGCG